MKKFLVLFLIPFIFACKSKEDTSSDFQAKMMYGDVNVKGELSVDNPVYVNKYLSIDQDISGEEIVEFDSGAGEEFNDSTHTFTTPADGTYLFIVWVTFEIASADDNVRLFLRKNGGGAVEYHYSRMSSSNSTYGSNLSKVLKLNSGDTIAASAYNVSNDDQVHGGSNYTKFQVIRLF